MKSTSDCLRKTEESEDKMPFSISVLFPAYNEAPTVYKVVSDAYAVVSSMCDDFEIIVCNDGSKDGTLGELHRLASEYPSVRIISNDRNRGLSFTFSRLYAEASKDYVFLNATDGQWPNSILVPMARLARNHDIVVSVRREKHYGWFRAFVSSCYNLLPKICFGVATQDAGGVKLIARRFVFSGALTSRSPFADAERLIRASYANARIVYIPVDVTPRSTGKSNAIRLRVLWGCFVDFWRLFFHLRLCRVWSI